MLRIEITTLSNFFMKYFNLSAIDPARHNTVRKHLLWEVNQDNFDYLKSAQIVVERVVQRGDTDDWLTILNLYGYEGVREHIKQIPHLNKKDMNFVHLIFDIPLTELKCYMKRQSVRQHWGS